MNWTSWKINCIRDILARKVNENSFFSCKLCNLRENFHCSAPSIRPLQRGMPQKLNKSFRATVNLMKF